MKINKIKINSYGKLKEKEINLKNGINILYGSNEAGKSTLLRFIVNSFYGISKNKKGKVYRDFKKKNPKIFNEQMEDISKEFNIDKNKGNEFFYEQTNVDEDLFLSTIVVGQQEVKLEKSQQGMLIQKIANLVGTGDDNVSYKRAIDRINRRQLDEIGTERSREKPINILARKIENLENEKEELEKYSNIKYQIEENKNILKEEIEELEKENNLLKEIKILNEKEKLEKEKINIQENIKNENLEKINLLENKLNEIKNNNKNILNNKNEKNNKNNLLKNKLNKKIIILFFLILLINILQFIFIKNKIINIIFLLTAPALLIYYIFSKNKINKKIKEEEKIEKNNNEILEKINLEINNIIQEINLLEKNNEEIKNKINNLKNNYNLKINLEKEKIKNKYINKLDNYKINNLINSENINYEIEKIQKEINNKKIKLHELEIDKENIEPKLDNLSKIEEELVNNNEEKVNLKKLERSMNLAKEILNKAYEEMKNTVTPKFTENLSTNISKITDGKYKHVNVYDENGMVVELENGNYVEASRLSVGTIDQLYLSLRLSMIDDLSEEKMPIILDEAFAYFDTERLKNILKYLSEEYNNRQIIILTCTEREKEIFEKENIEYNLINL